MATSTEVKRRYNEKTYKEWRTPIKIKDFEIIENLRLQENLSRSEFLKSCIKKVYNIEL